MFRQEGLVGHLMLISSIIAPQASKSQLFLAA